MATPANGQRDPDLYRLLGVARQATPAEITQAWRRKARAEHPDARTAIRVTVLSRTGTLAPSAPAHGAPLRAGPVKVEPPHPPAVPSPARDERAWQMLLAALALRHLAQGWN